MVIPIPEVTATAITRGASAARRKLGVRGAGVGSAPAVNHRQVTDPEQRPGLGQQQVVELLGVERIDGVERAGVGVGVADDEVAVGSLGEHVVDAGGEQLGPLHWEAPAQGAAPRVPAKAG